MERDGFSRFTRHLLLWAKSITVRLGREVRWALVWALLLTLVPWAPPRLTPLAERAFDGAPEQVQWAAPLALSVSGLADRALSGLGPALVYAGDQITLTLSKRDDGDDLGRVPGPGPDPLSPGDNFLVYYVHITNTGSVEATVHFTETLPPGLTCYDAGRVPGYSGGADWWLDSCSGNTVYLFSLDARSPFFSGLGPSSSAVLWIQAAVQWPLADGHVLENTQSSYTAFAAQEPQYTYYGSTDVTTTVRSAALSIAKAASPDPVDAGQELTLTLSISNSGSLALTAPFTLTVVDAFPSGTSYVRQVPFPNTSQFLNDGSSATWVIPFTSGGDPDLAPGETLVADLVVAVDAPFTHTAQVINTTYSVSIAPQDRATPSTVNGSAVAVEVSSRPSLTVAKGDAPDPVYADQAWTYWITVTNDAGANGNAVGLAISDVVPADTTLQSVSSEVPGTTVISDGVAGGSVITWTLPAGYSLFWGESTHVSFTVRHVVPVVAGPTVITNVTYGVAADNGPATVWGTPVTTTVIGEPDLALTKTPDGASAAPGEPITYWINYANGAAATANATGLVVTDVLPGYITGGTADPVQDAGVIAAGATITWSGLGSLAPGASGTITLVLNTVSAIDDGAVLANRARVTCAEGVSAADQGSYVVDSAPVLHIVKAGDPSPAVSTGGLLTYTIAYSNSGNMVASGVVVTDTVDPNVTVLSTDPLSDSMVGQDIVWSRGGLAPGVQQQITVVVRVDGALPSGSVITNTAQVASNEGVTAQSGDVTTTVRSPNISVGKWVETGLVRVGELVTYAIAFSNTGQIAAEDVFVTDTLPLSLTLVTSSTVGAAFDDQVGNSYRWISWDVPPGDVGAITVTARVTTAGLWVEADGTTLVNTAAASARYDSDPSDDLAQVPITVIPGLASQITLTVAPSTVPVPSTANLYVTVTDQYGNPAYNGDGITVSLGGSSASLGFVPPIASVADGSGAATVGTTVAGTYLVTASLGAQPSIYDTGTVTFMPTALDGFDIAPIGGQTAGISFTVSITAVDQYGNPILSFGGAVPIADSASPNTLLPPTVSFSGGRASDQVTITLARVDTIAVGVGVTQTNSNAFQVTPGPPYTVSVSTGQVDVPVGVDEPASALVVDWYGNPVAGDVVTWSITAGTVDPTTGSTNPSGVASAAVSHTVPAAATIVVTASSGVTGSTAITFIAGCPNTVTVTIAPSALPVGGSATITVHVQDSYGNDVDWATVDLSSAGLGGGSIVDASLALDASGQATTTISSTLVGLKSVLAETVAEGICSSTRGTGAVTYTAGTVAGIVVSMGPNPQVVGVNATLYATVTDQYGNPVPGEVVTFTAAPGALGGAGVAPDTGSSDGTGLATTSISSTVAGSALVTATLASNPTVSDVVTAGFYAGPPTAITLTVSPSTVDGGVDATLVATATDQYGNPCAGRPITITSGALGGGGISPNPSTADAGGVSTALISGTIAGPVVVTATAAPGVEDAVTLTVTTGLLDHLVASAVPDPLVAGVDFTLVITAVDAVGVPRSDSGTVSLADATGTLAPTSVSMVNGTATVALSVTQAMVDDVIWLMWVTQPSVIGTTNRFTVTAGAPYTVSLTANPASISPGGDTSTLVATVEDAYGNPVSGQVVTLSQAAGPTVSLAPASGTTGASGQVSTTLTSGSDQGTVTIDATCEGVVGSVDVSISTFFVYLPVISRSYTGVDLRPVGSIQVIGSGSAYEIQLTIENAGPNTVTVDFWVDLYFDPRSPIGVNVLWHQVGDYGKAWFVRQDLAPGQQIVLSSRDPDDPISPGDRYSHLPGTLNPGEYQLWAMVDSYGAPNIGAVIEYDEANNATGPH